MIEINSLNMHELEQYITSIGHNKFRAKQIYSWLHDKMVYTFDEMTNLPKKLRQVLEEECYINNSSILKRFISDIDGTIKFLIRLNDNNIIESVLMDYKHGYALCISSQVGCRMGCEFCASTIGGLERNLTAAEMLNQVYIIQNDQGIKISNIVIMGSGEPLDNYDNLIKFLHIINSDEGQNISLRNITVSTCGLVDKMRKLADEKLQITLAISLHAPNDDIRRATMPIAKKYSIDDIIKACRYYIKHTNRRITFEYALIKGVNDSKEHAIELANRLKGLLCHVNLIPVNDVKEKDFIKSSNSIINRFASILKDKHVNVTIRRELGSDINAACGQLRKSFLED